MGGSMTQAEFVAECYSVAWASNPDLDDSSSFQDVVKELQAMKDKAMRWEIIISSFKPEPQLPRINQCDI
jgi:hypothetical protein